MYCWKESCLCSTKTQYLLHKSLVSHVSDFRVTEKGQHVLNGGLERRLGDPGTLHDILQVTARAVQLLCFLVLCE